MPSPRLSSRSYKRLSIGIAAAVVLGVGGFLLLSSPWMWSMTHPTRNVASPGPANPVNGRELFLAGDCATCHASPGRHNPLLLGGGKALDTAFGKFFMPNISSDPDDGIGRWTLAQFTRAMREGVGPDGRNLYPAFPYTSYQRLSADDVRDLFAYLKTLPPVPGKAPVHQLAFPYNLRRGVGIWRLMFLDGKPLDGGGPAPGTPASLGSTPAIHDQLVARGRYLVEGAAHCAECHSPRNMMGAIENGERFAGGPAPDGKGYFPNITQSDTGINFWAAASIVNYLKTGVSPLGKTAGGDMAEVVQNTRQLPTRDLWAMATYLKTIPGVDRPAPGQPEPNRTDKVVMIPVRHDDSPLPASPQADVARTDRLYVAATKPFFGKAEAVGRSDGSDGKLLAAATLHVLERDGDVLRVELDGWQPAGVTSVIYARRGKRILSALLDDTAAAGLERGPAQVDADTGAAWTPVKLRAWIDGTDLNTSVANLWRYSSALLNGTCAACHSLPEPRQFSANQWVGTLNGMRRYTSLTDDQYRMLLSYVQNHARDTAPPAAAKP
ncbi:cytochrome C [Burkholderia glumae]|uniref:c-type cytochrome n=1 Tax=Burkholderia glumae TaxID=337 RepID=UPI00216470DB|nr:c-type cytochrome [Burkholderia glumae]UVS86383.1 cytochrome C [Burkholderia glumae]